MKHLIMGTAGHVDHGKTSLVKALTRIDCDTHVEEKKRGITIHLGFAHLDLGDGETLGIVDVPGHKDFIHTMVGGASGIDFVLLVIAADSGIMPQTREHLNIMRILGIKRGIIALTKADLVDAELLAMVREEVSELVAGTFLEDAPIIDVSAKTGAGLEALQDAIRTLVQQSEAKPEAGVFRLFVDRIFTVSGFGTVVTGSVLSGKVKTGDTLHLLPGKEDGYRVRRLERHGAEMGEIVAGDRASINLVGLERADFRRGMLLSDRLLRPSTMIDARLEIYEPEVALGHWSQVIFHVGTHEQQARLHLLDKDKLKAGETALVQIHLREPSVLQHGDRFVIRNSSDEWTLGGGEVIDIAPLHHRRRKEKVIQEVGKLAEGKMSEIIGIEVRKFYRATTPVEIAASLNVAVEKVDEALARKLPSDIVRQEGRSGVLLMTRDGQEDMRKGINKAIQAYKSANPLAGRGADFDEIRSFLRLDRNTPGEEMLRVLLVQLTEKGKLQEKDKTWQLVSDLGEISDEQRQRIAAIESYIQSCGLQVPLMSVMEDVAAKQNMSDKDLKQVLHHLVVNGAICRVQDEVISRRVVDDCRQKLVERYAGDKQGFTVADFRDLTGSNRKTSLLLLAIFDQEKLTRRQGDLRVVKA
ncbi:MAG: selB [Proteobacteria bacterium]|nr:selB [Pseudomonadota bacterium]